jgi:hypothetical protein
MSFEKAQVPITWKEANVSPVHKKNSRSNIGNYRPISLLSTLSKVQERVVYRRLYRYLADNNLLTDKNSGFKERDSAMCQLIKIVDTIYRALEDGKDISMVFLDISKAFDRVWHKGLLQKLKANGIEGKLLNWIENYLCDRKIRVVLNGQKAQWATTNAGVPQGSILGPLLFLVFINDVVDGIDSNINLFADDTSLLNIIDQIVPAYETVNNDLTKLSDWASKWLVNYNAAKTVSLHISRNRQREDHPPLTLNGARVEEVESHCHLGIDFEQLFTWLTHILRIAGKAAKCVGLMRRVCRELPRTCLENLYTTMVRPILEYGGVLFDGSPQYHTEHLDKIQREAALVCTGAYKHTKNSALMTELGWDSLQTRRTNQKLCLMYKMQRNLAPPYLTLICPPLVGEISNYPLRNATNIAAPMGRKSGYFNSFMPSAIRAWNGLDRNIRSRKSIDSFKYHLKKKRGRHKNKLYPRFNGSWAVQHTRMRLGLSGLMVQRHDYNHVPRSTCEYCGARKDDTMHFFLQCQVFDQMRIHLLERVSEIYQSKNITHDMTRTLVKKQLVNSLLTGDVRLGMGENIELFNAVQTYIGTTKRFR